MLPRDDDQFMLKVPHPLAVAERLFAADLLTQHQSFVDGGGKQAAVGSQDLSRFPKRDHGQSVIAGLLI